MTVSVMAEIPIAGVRVSTDHFIGNRRIASSRTFEVQSPIDGSVLGQFSAGGREEVDRGSVLWNGGSVLCQLEDTGDGCQRSRENEADDHDGVHVDPDKSRGALNCCVI